MTESHEPEHPAPPPALSVPPVSDAVTQAQVMALLQAVAERRLVRIRYRERSARAQDALPADAPASPGSDPLVDDEGCSDWTLRPLGCFAWGDRWALAAWCIERGAFQTFHVERIELLTALDERFEDEAGRTLADHQRALEAEMTERDSATDA